MKTLHQVFEVCKKLGVDPAEIKISNGEWQNMDEQIKDKAIKQMLSKKEPAQKPVVSSKSQPS